MLRRIIENAGPVLITGGEAYGAPFLVEALARQQRVAWFELQRHVSHDPVALNNALAHAVNKALCQTLLTEAVPYRFALATLARDHVRYGSFNLVCSYSERNQEFRDELLRLQSTTLRIILVDHDPVQSFYGVTLHTHELALTEEEADDLAGPYLKPSETQILLAATGRAYTTFTQAVARLGGRTPERVPSPTEPLLPQDQETFVDPHDLLGAFVKLGRYVDALELAALSLPEQVPGIIGRAGPEYQKLGLLSRLHILLESLDDPFRASEEVLEWRLVSGFHEGDYAHLVPLVEETLRRLEAPNLRARYAGLLLDPVQRLQEAERAARADPNPLTYYQWGRLEQDEGKTNGLLKQSVAMAERFGSPYEIVRNTAALARSFARLGNFREAASWNRWAQVTSERYALNNGSLALGILNTNVATSLLLGNLDALEEEISRAADVLAEANMLEHLNFRVVQANYYVLTHQAKRAQDLLEPAYADNPRQLVGEYTVPLVRALLAQGKTEQAVRYGEQAVALLRGEASFYALPAALALGMACAEGQPERAAPLLRAVLDDATLEADLRLPAALHLIVIGALSPTDLAPDLKTLLFALTPTALALYCNQNESFQRAWSAFSEPTVPLRIHVLGRADITYRNRSLKLKGRQLEILTLLALQPEGVSPEVLHTQLYRNAEISLISLRSTVSRLRALVPITEAPEYRLDIPYTIDARDVLAALKERDLRRALELYRGPLCPMSEAPYLCTQREVVEEQLKQSVMHSQDLRYFFLLAEKLPDDLEVWEALETSLSPGDERLAFVRAELTRAKRELLF